MKAKKIGLSIMLCGIMLFAFTGISQEKEDYQMAEITFMLPKIGMEKAFEDAVKEHNTKFHKEAPYKANLDYILTGEETGWYVWLMAPCTFTDLDKRPNNETHRAHWDKTISPLIKKYGRTEYWRFNNKLSHVTSGNAPKLETIWMFDIKEGDYYRFQALIEKVKEAHKKKGDEFSVYINQFSEGNGRQIALVWPHKNWADLDIEDGGIKTTYEEINGEGSWANLLDEWREITTSFSAQLWKIGI